MSDALRDGVERFLAGLRTERRLSPHTADGYGRDLAALLDYCEAQGITAWEALDPQHVRSFAAQCHRRGESDGARTEEDPIAQSHTGDTPPGQI